MEQLWLLKDNGADLTKVCLSHCDLTKDVDYLKRLCDQGANLSFDRTLISSAGLTDVVMLVVTNPLKSTFAFKTGAEVVVGDEIGRWK